MNYNSFITPNIVLSRCFLKPVRYDGGIVNNEFVERLKNFIKIIDICPETDIGLSVPRARIIIIKQNNSKIFFQPDTNKDLTNKIREYSIKTLKELFEIDGFLLKAKSPSCGVKSTKIYCVKSNEILERLNSKKTFVPCGKTDGLFAESCKEYFNNLPIEDENRLNDEDIRYHFLSRIFAFSELRHLCKNYSPQELVDFHSRFKYLLMAYNQKALSELGRLVANSNIKIEDKIKKYSNIFYQALKTRPSKKKHINTLMHIFGHISDKLNKNEKKHFLHLLEEFKNDKINLKTIIELLWNFTYRFENKYLMIQRYLKPFPEEIYI